IRTMRIETAKRMRRVLAAVAVVPALMGCEEQAETPAAEPAAATATAPVEPAAPAEPPEEEPKRTGRPATLDLALSDARRSAIEAKYGDAKGFVVAKDLEEKLKKNEAIKEKEAAVKAFDRMAKGKWVLFTGPAVNFTDDGFDLGIVYTPQLPNDPMGMSRQFFEVTLEEVEGYDKDAWKVGNPVAVLAKYQGGGKAGPGHELVAVDVWK